MTKTVPLTDLTHKKLVRLATLLSLERGERITIQEANQIAIEEGVNQRIIETLNKEFPKDE